MYTGRSFATDIEVGSNDITEFSHDDKRNIGMSDFLITFSVTLLPVLFSFFLHY